MIIHDKMMADMQGSGQISNSPVLKSYNPVFATAKNQGLSDEGAQKACDYIAANPEADVSEVIAKINANKKL